VPVTVLNPTAANPNALLTGVVDVKTAYLHTCALLANGTVRCWGSNSVGMLGNPTPGVSKTPVTVTGLSGVTTIAAGDQHTCALLRAGSIVKCWGLNNAGQLGDSSLHGSNSATPVTVAGLTNVATLAGGVEHTCALLANGTVKCWGGNVYRQLGNGSITGTPSPTPVQVTGIAGGTLTGVRSITAGTYHSCALLAVAGGVVCWGRNSNGQLGNGSTATASPPVAVSGL
jgi:alpha-tubulin suppressor-like RCC1 family protein